MALLIMGGREGGGKRTINMPKSTEGSGRPTMRPLTGYPVYGLMQEVVWG